LFKKVEASKQNNIEYLMGDDDLDLESISLLEKDDEEVKPQN
jgi:hypothetical protein